MLFKLLTLQFLNCIVISVEAIHSDYASSWWDYPRCDECPTTLGKIGATVRGALDGVEAASYDICALNKPTEKKCLAATNLDLTVIRSINSELFPRPSESSTRSLSCSHIIGLCADHGADEKDLDLEPLTWSCSSCETFLQAVLRMLNKTPLEDINHSAATFFCGEKEEEECRSQFSPVVELSGILGKILLREKKSIDEACRTVIKCIA